MKTIQDYIQKARKETNTSNYQLSDSELLDYLNRRRNELANEIIRSVNEDFFYEIFTTDLIAGQNEYSLQECSAEKEGIKKLISIEVKRNEQEPYRLIPKKSMSTTGLSLEEMGSLSKTQAFWDIKDSSIFLFPASDDPVLDGIRGQAIASIKDLKLTDREDQIFPWHSDLREWNELIYIWAKIDCWSAKQDFEKKQMARNDYEMKKKQMLTFLTDRYKSPSEFQSPNLDYYKY